MSTLFDPPVTRPVSLRDYQSFTDRALYDGVMEHQTAIAEVATGLGKSLIAAALSERFDTAVISTPIKETMKQLGAAVRRYRGYSPSVEQADLWGDPEAPCTVACLQSLLSNNRYQRFLGKTKLLVIDEAHYAMGPRFRELLAAFKATGTKIAAMTATPHCRPNGVTPLTDYACAPVTISIRQGIEWGWLTPFRAYRCVLTKLDMSRFQPNYGGNDFLVEELDAALAEEGVMLEQAAMIERNHKRPGIVFTTSIKNARTLSDILENRHGIPTSVVHTGKDMTEQERERQLARFESGESELIVNVGCLTTGWDSPRVAEIHNLRPTRSLPKYLQQLGRGCRLSSNKVIEGWPSEYSRRLAISRDTKPDCLVFDYTDASRHHQICCAADAFVPAAKKREKYVEELIDRGEEEAITLEAVDEAIEAEKKRDAAEAVANAAALRERRRPLVFRADVDKKWVDLFKKGEAETPKRREARMTWGPYKGIPIRMIPIDYLKGWIRSVRRSPGNEWLIEAVRRELQRSREDA